MKLKRDECTTFEERILQWADKVKPGSPPTRVSHRERRPPDRYKPLPFSGKEKKEKKNQKSRIMDNSPPPQQTSLKRPLQEMGSLLTRSLLTSKRTKTDTIVTQVKDLMTFHPAMYGRTPKEFVEAVEKEEVMMREFEKLKDFLRLHISRSTMKDAGLIPSRCKEFIENSESLRRVSYDFPPDPEVYGDEWEGIVGREAILVHSVERIMENTQRYNSQSPEDSWCGQIVQPLLDLMQTLYSGKVVSVITQNEVITPQELCPKDQNERIPQSGRKKVDHILGLQISEDQEARIRQYAGFSKSVNQSIANSLSSIPIFLDVEVKTVNKSDPLVQLRIWEAAGHSKRQLENWSTEMPMLGIVVDGHNWNLQVGLWSPNSERLIYGAGYHLGSTNDIVSIFHIISNLHKICNWAHNHYRQWFERQLENYERLSQTRSRRALAATSAKKIAAQSGSDGDGEQENDDEEDEALHSERVDSVHSRLRQSTRKRRIAERKLSPPSRDLRTGDRDPVYELQLVAIYEHSRTRGHKICAYRGCHENEDIKGDVNAFATNGEPRKSFSWLHKPAERQLRKEAAAKAVTSGDVVMEEINGANGAENLA